jgi:hypothetical protein
MLPQLVPWRCLATQDQTRREFDMVASAVACASNLRFEPDRRVRQASSLFWSGE